MLWSFGSLTRCSLVGGALPFRRNLLCLQSATVCSPETVVQILQTTHCHNPEGYNMYLHCTENLIICKLKYLWWVLQWVTITILCLGSDLIFSKSVLLRNHYKCYCSWWVTLLSRTWCITHSLLNFYLHSTVVFFFSTIFFLCSEYLLVLRNILLSEIKR